ncbi:MAG: hypothetical protein SFW35_07545 [Chitinophagales bacterium]|nr:hypothetical protein [Chitinophagales bacterium]
MLLFLAIYKQVFKNEDIGQMQSYIAARATHHWALLTIVLLLMPFNWLLEAIKWRLLMRPIEVLSYVKALKAVLAGLTFTMFTPNRIGEYGGRFMFIKEPLRATAFQATILGSIAQMVATLGFGLIALVVQSIFFAGFVPIGISAGAVCFIGLLILIFIAYRSELLADLLPKRAWAQSILQKLQVLHAFRSATITGALLLAALRYAVYTLQYVLLLYVFVDARFLSLIGFQKVSLFFLVQTAIPSIALLDLGIRGNLALALFRESGGTELGIITAAFSLWVINLMLPSIFGYLIILWKRWFQGAKSGG